MAQLMATLIFICDDGMDGVAAMGNGVGIHLWKQCDRVVMAWRQNCMTSDLSAARKRDWWQHGVNEVSQNAKG